MIAAVLLVVLAVAFVVLGFQFVVDRWVDTFIAARDLWKDDK